MSAHRDIAARLRAANPAPGTAHVEPPAVLLARIAGTPRERRPAPRGRALRRPLLLACLALLLAAGLAVAATISVRYFDELGSKLPAPVRSELAFTASHSGPVEKLDLEGTITAYAFTSSSASGRVYVAPYIGRSGFCAALAVTGKPVQATCSPTFAGQVETLGGLQPWSLALTPDMHAMLGRLSPAAAGESVQLAFEDGTTTELPMRDRWFAYAVADTHTRPGHRPVELRFLRDRRVVRRSSLSPTSFNTLAEARALVPASDGSTAQNAIRRLLLQNIESRIGDGGLQASHTRLSHTIFVTTLRFPSGLHVSAYTAPITPLQQGAPGGTLIIGLDGRSTRPVFYVGSVNTGRASDFGAFTCGCVVPGHPRAQFTAMAGNVPRGVRRVSVRMSDGSEHPAVVFAHGTQWMLLARRTRARPVALIGRNATGTALVTRSVLLPRPASHRSG
jgi:hypothetical protein